MSLSRRFDEFDDFEWSTRKSPRGRTGRLIVLSVLGLAVVYGLGVWSGVRLSQPSYIGNTAFSNGGVQQQQNQNQNQQSQGMVPQSNAGNDNVITEVYNASKNSIVTITAVTSNGGSKNGSQEDVGTGFFIDTQGDIATNAHVVNGAKTVSVTLSNRTFTGQVIGTDELDDLAVVRIHTAENISPLRLGTAKTLQPGDLVVAIGNPFQLTSSVSSGIVSGLNRSMPTQTGRVMSGLVQTDAALNPGNSGGPLLDASGEVIGINTAIESPVEGSVGIGFAIPIDRLKQLLPQLLSGNSIQHAWLGIEGLDIDKLAQQELKLPVSEGIYVTVVTKGGPADKAGLHGDSSDKVSNMDNANSYQQVLNGDGDIIVAADGKTMNSVEDLTQYLSGKSPGDSVLLSVIRKGKKMDVKVTLSNWPSSSK